MVETGLKRFEGKIALVFGGGGGMGSATSKRFAQEGATVIVVDYKPEKAEEVVKEIIAAGGKAEAMTCNNMVEAEVIAVLDAIAKKYGRLDYAINNTGGNPTSSELNAASTENFKAVIDSYMTAYFYCLKYEAKLMVEGGGGSIVSISSTNATALQPQLGPYSAAKAAVEVLSKTLAMEVGPKGVRVNTVQPGFTKTPPNGFTRDPLYTKEILYKTPTRRMNLPEDIAAACLFLCSNDAFNITAVSLPVDGGELTEGYPDVYEIRAGVPRFYDGPELGR